MTAPDRRIYDVAAWFARPVDGADRATTRDARAEKVDAETPLAAARKWYWRLTPDQRAATVRLVVFAPRPKPVLPLYQGPPVRFGVQGGQLVELPAGEA